MTLLIFFVISLAEPRNSYDLQLFSYFEHILFTKYLFSHFF